MANSPAEPEVLPRVAPYKWLTGALVLVFLRVLPALRFPIGRDEATYCVIGQGLLRGQVLYRDLWDNKPPGIFYIYAVIVKIFGARMWSIGLIDVLWLLAISICIFYFAEPFLGAPAAALAVVINALWHCSWGYIHAAQPETFATLFVFLAYFLLASKRLPALWSGIAAGLLCGAAFWVKYNTAPLILALAFLPYLDFSDFDKEPRRVDLNISWKAWFTRLLYLASGFLIAIFGILIDFWQSGAMPALREVQFEVLPRYASTFLDRMPHYWSFAISLINLHLGIWTEAAFGTALVLAWWRRELRIIAPVVMMAVAGFISTASQVRFSSYAFETAYPFFAMIWGYVILTGAKGFQFLRGYFKLHGWRLAGTLLWLAAAQVIYFPLPSIAYTVGEDYRGFADWMRNPWQSYVNYAFQIPLEKLHDQLAIIDYLRKTSGLPGGVFVWGAAPLINFLTQRPNPSRFISNFALISPWGPARWRQELIGELNRRPPRYIVVARHDEIPVVTLTYDDSEKCISKFPEFGALLKNQYEPVENLDDFELYIRKSP